MIVCTMCGQHNGDDAAFCGDCGRFLEWTGEKMRPEPEVVVVAEPEPEPAQEPRRRWWRRLVDRLRQRFPAYRITPRESPTPDPRVPHSGPASPPPATPEPPPATREPPPPAPGQLAAGVKELPVAGAKSLPPVGAKSLPAAGTKSLSAAGATKLPAGGAEGPPAAGTKKLPVAGAEGLPAAGTKKLPAAGAKALPAAGAKQLPAGTESLPAAGTKKLPAAGTKKLPAAGTKKLPAAGTRKAPDKAAAKAPDKELVAALVNPVDGTATNQLVDAPPELPPQQPKQKTKAITRTKPSRRLEPGDLVCGVCGEGNAPSRRFCSRCGEGLDQAGVVRAVWWRRFITWLFRPRRKAYPAGTRPGQKGTRQHRKWVFYSVFRKVRVVLAIVAVIIALSYALYPPFRDSVRDNFSAIVDEVMPALKPVYPQKVEANLALGEHTADKLADTYRDTYWAARWGSTTVPKISVKFESHVLLRSMILYASDTEDFVSHGRPSIFRITYSTGKVDTLIPQDQAGQQTLTFKNNTLVDGITLEIVDIYGGREGADVAISEIEFFALR